MTTKRRLDAEAWASLIDYARSLGFLEMAAAPKAPVRYETGVRRWVAENYHADMHWFARAIEKRLDLDLVLEGAASVLVLTTPYHREPCTLAGKKLARYACGDDYHDVLKKKLWLIIERLKESTPQAECRPYVDTGPILERYWAEEAGLGWIGKNGNLISRTAGSYLFLACIVTDVVVPYGRRHESFCGNCRACLDACPTDAFVREGVVDSRKCISYLNIEHRGDFPDETPDFHDWIFGCDICQEVCPWVRKFSREELMPELRPRAGYPDLDVAAMEQEDFSAAFRKSAIKRTKMSGLKRNLDHLQTADRGD
ncbi:MAG: tRNA epoxyqueuosine(34) reductase QueG [Acidobacteriota bacterium]|nr:tRNA epoxyqueuosine(34) reductase QueG [Acidobacteriota bacterium]